MINQLIATGQTYNTQEEIDSRLLTLPDIRMGNVIGDPPELSLQLTAKAVAKSHFGESVTLAPIVNGLTSKVFIAQTPQSLVVIKMRQKGETITGYQWASWATNLAIAHNIPAPATLAIGQLQGYPYMISSYMSGIPGNIYQGDQRLIWFQLGKFAQRINTISTNARSNLEDYIMEVLPVFSHSYRTKWQILSRSSHAKLFRAIERLRHLSFEPHLVHKDLVPRNVKVDKSGKLVAILDWDNATSQLVPSLEFALALEDKTNRQKGLQAFMQGYGISRKAFSQFEQQIIDLCSAEYLRRLRIKIDKGNLTGAYIDEQKIMEFLEGLYF